jgi:serine/threonine-protein kinase
MERMAISSGSSIAAFVASNAALPSVENAANPPELRDWTPIQAFIAAAAQDQSVRWLTMIDADGIIRGASDSKLLGTRYAAPVGETVVQKNKNVTVTEIKHGDRQGFRFTHPILYADRTFGMIEVSISKAELQAAAATSRNLMIGLAAMILAVVGAISFTVAKLLGRPVRRLNRAFRDAAMGDLDFRISHGRRDEFGELFDGFNLFTAAVQDRLAAAERPGEPAPSLDGTRTMLAKRARAPKADAKSDSAGTPFDPAWRESA